MMVLFLGLFIIRLRLDAEVFHGVLLSEAVPLQEKVIEISMPVTTK